MISAGFDIGTRFIKICLVEDGRILGSDCVAADRDISGIIKKSYRNVLKTAGVKKRRVAGISVTGYGAELVRRAARRIPEAPCLAAAVRSINCDSGRDIRRVVDVGALFTHIVVLDENGHMDDAFSNDRCAAGSGKFLEMVARAVEVPVEAISEYVLSAEETYDIKSSCAVFAESEIISQLNTGRAGAEVVAGVVKSIASRAVTLLNRADVPGEVALCGGVSEIDAFRRIFADLSGRPVTALPLDDRIITAYGAALLVKNKKG